MSPSSLASAVIFDFVYPDGVAALKPKALRMVKAESHPQASLEAATLLFSIQQFSRYEVREIILSKMNSRTGKYYHSVNRRLPID